MTIPAGAPALPAPGDRVGKYVLTRVIGEGGMGVVFEAEHQRIGQKVAIKVLAPRALTFPEIATRFEREARAAGQLKSRHAARVLDVDQTEGGLPYIVMELLEGHDLAHEITARGSLPIGEAVDVALQACAAMAEAHARGIVHRDLKPANLFSCVEGGARVVKVLDFGISKLASDGDTRVTATSATMGTPLYMSPEQVRSAKSVDARTDIWALGVILFEMLTGRPPFEGQSATAVAAAIVADAPLPIRDLRAEVPEALAAIVHKALAKDPAARFADVRAMAEALAPFAATPQIVRELDVALAPRARVSSNPSVQPTPSMVNAPTMLVSDADAKAQGEAVRTTLGWATREGKAVKRVSPLLVALVAIAVVAAIGGVAFTKLRAPGSAAATQSAPVSAPAPASASALATAPASAPNLTQSGGFATPAQLGDGRAAGANPTGDVSSPLRPPGSPAPTPTPTPASSTHLAPRPAPAPSPARIDPPPKPLPPTPITNPNRL